jgi:hypothetical protein
MTTTHHSNIADQIYELCPAMEFEGFREGLATENVNAANCCRRSISEQRIRPGRLPGFNVKNQGDPSVRRPFKFSGLALGRCGLFFFAQFLTFICFFGFKYHIIMYLAFLLEKEIQLTYLLPDFDFEISRLIAS